MSAESSSIRIPLCRQIIHLSLCKKFLNTVILIGSFTVHVKGSGWRYSIVLLLSINPMKRLKQSISVSLNTLLPP